MKLIHQYIKDYFGISTQNLEPVSQLFRETRLSRGEELLRIGQYSRDLHFIQDGLMRMYAYNESGEKEITQWIAMGGSLVTEFSCFMFNSPSRYNIQALTECSLFTISKENYDSIGQQVSNWAELDKLFVAKCFVHMENRIFSQLSMTAEEKYRKLLAESPELFQQVPLQYLASMMGMSPETLSRVRKKLSS